MTVESTRSTQQQSMRFAVGVRMAARRRRCGLTAEQLAARARIKASAVRRLERGETIPVIPTYLLIGALYRLGVEDTGMRVDGALLGRVRAAELEAEIERRRPVRRT